MLLYIQILMWISHAPPILQSIIFSFFFFFLWYKENTRVKGFQEQYKQICIFVVNIWNGIINYKYNVALCVCIYFTLLLFLFQSFGCEIFFKSKHGSQIKCDRDLDVNDNSDIFIKIKSELKMSISMKMSISQFTKVLVKINQT